MTYFHAKLSPGSIWGQLYKTCCKKVIGHHNLFVCQVKCEIITVTDGYGWIKNGWKSGW